MKPVNYSEENPGKRRKPTKAETSDVVQESSVASPIYGVKSETKSVRSLSAKFGLRQETLSRMTGFSVRSVAEWAGGKAPSAPAKKAFQEMDRLLDALAQLMEPREVGKWIKEPNPAFDGSTPLQVIERGQSDRIWRMLYFIESGEPG